MAASTAGALSINYGPLVAPQDPAGGGPPTTVKIIWWTDEPTSANTAYVGAASTGPWVFTGTDTANSTRHEVLIAGLTGESTYYVYVSSGGASSAPAEFRTGGNLLANGSFETWHSVSGEGWGAQEPDGWSGWEIYPWQPSYANHITIQMDRNTGVPSPLVRDGSHRASMDEGWRCCYGGLYQQVHDLPAGSYVISGWVAWLYDGITNPSGHKIEIIAKDGAHAPGQAPTGTVVWAQNGSASDTQWKYVQGAVECSTGTITVYCNLRADSPDGGSFAHFDGMRLMAAARPQLAISNIGAAVDVFTGTSCAVTWDTSLQTTINQVYYRRLGEQDYTVVSCSEDPAPAVHHSAILAPLGLGTTYEYHVESTGPDGTVTSTTRTFQTPAQPGISMFYGFSLVGGSILEGGDDVGPGNDWEHLMLHDHPWLTISGLGFSSWAQCQPNDPGDGPNTYDWSYVDASIAKAVPGKARLAYYQMWGTSPDWVTLDTPRFWEKFEEFVEAQVTHINERFGEVDIVFENEPNISRAPEGWHWADWYIHCLQHFHAAVHRANARTGVPNKVIAGNLAGHSAGGYAELYQRGLKSCSDIIGTHPYPDNIVDGVKVEDLATVRSCMEQYGDGDKKIWISEGWGSGRSAGFDRSSPLIEPTAQEIENMWYGLAKGFDNLMTPREHWDPSCLWGINFFCANDNWGAMGWRRRAAPQKDDSGNIVGFIVDGYWMTPDIAPYFWNGGMYDFYGNSKDALHLLFPGNGLVFMNPGFELRSEPPKDHTPHFWTTLQDPPATANYSLDDVIYHGGSRCLKLTRAAAGTTGVWQQTAKRSAGPGNTYRARVWCKTEDVSGVAGRFYMRFRALDGSTVSSQHWAADVTGNTDWTLMQITAAAPAGTSRVEVGCQMTGIGTVRFDDITIATSDRQELGIVKGYTLDENQVPVPHSIVSATTGGFQAISDERGYYEMTGVPSGTYDFICRKPGYVPFRTRNQTVAAGKVSFVMFCMGPPKPGLAVTDVQADTSSWYYGEEPVSVSVTVQNTGQYPVNLSDVGLFIENGSEDATGRFTIHADPYNPKVISAFATAQFSFGVTPRETAKGLSVSINAYAFGQEDRPNMLTNGGFDDDVWSHHWSFSGGASLTWNADTTDFHSPPRSLKNTISSNSYTWNWASNWSAWGATALPAKPHTNYTIGCYHKDQTTPNTSVCLFIEEFYYDGSNWRYNGRRFTGMPKRSTWAHDCMIYLTGDPNETQGLYATNRLVASVGPCTNDRPASGTTWCDDLYLKETGDWLADDRADSGAALAVARQCSTLAEAFAYPEGTAVQVSGQIVTAGVESFSGFFYVESPDRTRGARVVPASGSIPGRGTTVQVTGVMGGVDGEKALVDASIVTGAPASVPAPLGVIGRTVASKGPGGSLLVRTWGKVTYVSLDGGFFLIDDGSGIAGVEGKTGLKVTCSDAVPEIAPPSVGQFVSVTGIASCEAGGTLAVVKPREQADIALR